MSTDLISAEACKRRSFILENTSLQTPPHVPEISLYLASEAYDLWRRTEEELQEIGLPPPFWAFAWAGGQGLARFILDNPQHVAGRSVADLASGSGLVAIAAAMAGAAHVEAFDIDPYCESAVALNASQNGVSLAFSTDDLLTMPEEALIRRLSAVDILLAGDVFYDREMALLCTRLIRLLSDAGKTVLIGDPGRAYLPSSGLACLAEYEVHVTRELEDSEVKRTRVWQPGT